MGKNKGKGGKNFRAGKKDREDTRRELLFKDEVAQEGAGGSGAPPQVEYAKVVKMLGDCRCEVFCYDGKDRSAEIRGGLRNRIFINVGDHVLVAVRSYQTDKCDIFHKYMPDEVLRLVHLGELDPALAGVEDADVVTGEDLGKDGELDIDKI